MLLGIGLSLLLRSPFRMPIGERLFRVVWLGPTGRFFLRFSGRGVARRSGSPVSGVSAVRSRIVSPPVAPAKPPAAAPAERIAALETRVAELERWRRER